MSITNCVLKVCRVNSNAVINNAVLVTKVWEIQNPKNFNKRYDPASIIRVRYRLIRDGILPSTKKGV